MNDAICIRSTYKQLWDCLRKKECYLGSVSYLNYDTDAFGHDNTFNAIMRKRTSYSHDREVRAVVWRMDNFLAPDPEPIPMAL